MVEGFCGLPGSGKTYLLAKLGLDAIKKNRQVFSNFKLTGSHYYTDLSDVFAVREGVILVDEINLVCPSRWWNNFPPRLAYFWSQTRKMKLDIYWTAQHPDRVDKIVKEISNWIWQIRKFPFGFFLAFCYLPEHYTRERRRNYGTKFLLLTKKVYKSYNTFEMIELPEYLATYQRSSQFINSLPKK